MSGPLTVPFAIAAVFVPQVWLKILLAVLSLVCAVASSYAVWRRQREAFLQECDRNQKPDIKAQIEEVLLQRSPVTTSGHEGKQMVRRSTLYITVTVHFVNSRPPDATIDRLTLAVETPSRVLRPSLLSKRDPFDRTGMVLTAPKNISEIEANVLLRQGVGVTRFVRFIVEEWDSDDLERTGVLRFTAVDSFGIERNAEWSLANEPALVV
jgi:hypothetical protein